jgi:hypothetical protein
MYGKLIGNEFVARSGFMDIGFSIFSLVDLNSFNLSAYIL